MPRSAAAVQRSPAPAWAASYPLTPDPVPQNVFGAAKPREAVIAERTGKTEEEILREAVRAEKLRVRPPAATWQRRSHPAPAAA